MLQLQSFEAFLRVHARVLSPRHCLKHAPIAREMKHVPEGVQLDGARTSTVAGGAAICLREIDHRGGQALGISLDDAVLTWTGGVGRGVGGGGG